MIQLYNLIFESKKACVDLFLKIPDQLLLLFSDDFKNLLLWCYSLIFE